MSPSFLDRCKPRVHAKGLATVPVLLAALISVGCGGMSNSGTPGQSAHTQLKISPRTLVLGSGSKQQFTATVSNTSNSAVTWSASSGTITNGGLYVAPLVTSDTRVEVSAASVEDKSSTAVSILTIEPKQPLHVNTTEMPGGVVGVPYTLTLSADGGLPPYRWRLTGPPPQGLSLDSGSGAISGTPTKTGSFPMQVVVSDSSSNTATQSLNLLMAHAHTVSGNYDGPAELPRVYIQSTLADTPAPGNVTSVSATGDLQAALDNASCGDTIKLQAGATYAGVFTLPAKNCDDNHWIILRTSAPDSALPTEGTRITPCYAGLSSLPGRPALNCTSTRNNVMVRIAGAAKQNRIIGTASGANYYRLIGLEIADTGANGNLGGFYDLVALKSADHIIVDRCWIHGSPLGEDVKGVGFELSSYIAVIDSYISDIHSKVSGYGADSSAIGSVTGTGPVKIVNNFLEASGCTILWGGGASSFNVTDVEFRRNHVFKPFTWWEHSPTYLGTLFAAKNLFENKTGVRELIEGNIFENNWAQAQKGTAIVFSPKNQTGKCPGCTVHDVIFRYNIVRHSVNGIGMATAYATTCQGQSGNGNGSCQYLSGALYNLSIHDNLLDDISQPTYWPGDCCTNGSLFTIGTGQLTNWPHDIAIDHNTGFPDGSGTANITIHGAPQVIANFSFNNNLVGTGNSGFHQVYPGNKQPGCGSTNAAGVLGILNGCMGNSWQFTGNVLVNNSSSSKFPGSVFPPGNVQAASLDSVGFVDAQNGNGGDYQLLPSSQYKNSAPGGKDPGADIVALMVATAGVL
jgi:hypothetical protein